MKGFALVVVGALLLAGLSLAPTILAGQTPPGPCDLLTSPGLKSEYLSGGHESWLKRFCSGNLPSFKHRVYLPLILSTGGTRADAPVRATHQETPLQSNVLVNSRADTFPHITESETSIDAFDATSDGLAEQIVMAWNGAVGSNHGLGHGFSLDGGATWTDAGLLPNPPNHDNCCDPAVAVNSTGTFHIVVLTGNVTTGDNDLGISTLTPPGAATVLAIIPGPINADREDLAVDNTGTAGTNGNIYVCYAEFGLTGSAVPIRLVRSTDGGVTWSAPINLVASGQSGQACRVEVGRGGDVFVTWHRGVDANTAEIHIRRCTPGSTECASIGEWSADTVIDTITRAQDPVASGTSNCDRPALNGFVRKTFENPTLAINRVTGRVHVAYSFKDSSTAADDANIRYQALNPNLTVAIAPTQLNIDGTTTDQWRAFLAVTSGPSPALAVAWYSRQLDSGNLRFDVFKRESTDDGLNFGPEIRVTTASSAVPTLLPNFDPDIADCYMSDYETMDADNRSFFIGWSDSRLTVSSTPDPDIRFSTQVGVPRADLSIAKTDSPDPAVAGQNLTYVLTVSNSGLDGASGVTLTDTLPAGVTFVSATPSHGACLPPVGLSVTCNLGNLANGASAAVTIVVTVNASTPDGAVLTNTAETRGNELDPRPGDNTASVDTRVIRKADLSITKAGSPDPVVAGSSLTYTVRVINNGPSIATGVTVTDTLRPEVTLVSASAGCAYDPLIRAVTCTLGSLADGASATVTIVVTPNSGCRITNTARVTGNETDPSMTNNIAVEATTVHLDNFNRPDGGLGGNWGGATGGYRIVGKQVDVDLGGPIYWQVTFGSDQAACVTLTKIDSNSRHHTLMLKVQSHNDWTKGVILVSYNALSGKVDVEARDTHEGIWRLVGSFSPPAPVKDGDRLAAWALTDGKVRVYINDVLLGTADAGSFYAGKDGQIGIWYLNAHDAILDDFGGGTVSP